MAARKLKPIEERDPYAAAVLDAFDQQEAEKPMPPTIDKAAWQRSYEREIASLEDELEKLRNQMHEYEESMRMAREHLSAAFRLRMGAESVLEHIQRAFRVWPKPAND